MINNQKDIIDEILNYVAFLGSFKVLMHNFHVVN